MRLSLVAVTLLKRVMWSIPVLFLLSLLMFVALKLVPGDAALVIAGERASAEKILAVRRLLRLDEPWYWQFLHYIKQVFWDFDWGRSLFHDAPVSEVLWSRLPATIELSLLCLAWALPVGIIMGTLAALYRHTFVDRFLSFISMAGVSIPVFWTALIVTAALSLHGGWFPTGGRVSDAIIYDFSHQIETHFLFFDAFIWGCKTGKWDVLQSAFRHAVLPTLTLSLIPIAHISKVTRSVLAESLAADFIRTARAKGVSGWSLVVVHALRASAVPIVTIVSLQAGALFGGAVLTETMFSWPGLGRALFESIASRDFPMIQAGTLFVGGVFVLVNALADVVYAWVDPRVGFDARSGER